LESTVRYLGIEVDDALILSEQMDETARRPPPRRSGPKIQRVSVAEQHARDALNVCFSAKH
jgi:hypothetical protein